MNQLLLGAIAMACLTVGTVMLRSWRATGDRFFLLFGISFFIESIARVALAMMARGTEHEPFVYLLRLASMLVVIYAIVGKNFRIGSRDDKS